MTPSYDLIVIGAGMAGVSAANKCAAQGWKVAIVDALPYGGTCALRGCDPKKILRRGAEIIDSARLMRGKGIDDADLSINWADLMKHKYGFTDPVPQNMEDSLTDDGIDTFHGVARFTDKNAIEIGGIPYVATHFLIATGARPRPLDFPGHEHLVDSTDFLDLAVLPPRILFVGGGFVSFEFAHISARAGSAPVIIDRGPRPLKGFDPDLVELLITGGAEAGIELQRSTTVIAIEKSKSGYQVSVERGGHPETMEFDLVVHGAGRTPELSGLDLDSAGVEWDEHGIHVAAHLQSTTNPAVYPASPALAASDGDETGDEVDVVRSQRDQLSGADAGLEHEPDDGLVPAVMQRFVRPVRGRGAGGDQGAEFVVGERGDQRVALRRSLGSEEGVGCEASNGDEPGGVPADRELTGPGGPRGLRRRRASRRSRL